MEKKKSLSSSSLDFDFAIHAQNPSNVTDLKQSLKEQWAKISPEMRKSFLGSANPFLLINDIII